jgi:hypothetical protein
MDFSHGLNVLYNWHARRSSIKFSKDTGQESLMEHCCTFHWVNKSDIVNN